MKLRKYVTSLADTAKEQTQRLHGTVRMAAIGGMTTGMMIVPTMYAYATDTAVGGTNLLDGEVMAAITNGFSSLVITATAVVAIAATTGISIIGLTAAVKYSMKKIKGVLSTAA